MRINPKLFRVMSYIVTFFYICLAFIGAVAALPDDESFSKTFARHTIIKESATLRV